MKTVFELILEIVVKTLCNTLYSLAAQSLPALLRYTIPSYNFKPCFRDNETME